MSARMTSPEPTDGSRSGSPASPVPSAEGANHKPRLSFSISRLLGDDSERRPDGGLLGPSPPSAAEMPALVAAAQLSPLHLGANGTVIRVPAHRPAPLGAAFPSFPWIGPAHPAVKDRLQANGRKRNKDSREGVGRESNATRVCHRGRMPPEAAREVSSRISQSSCRKQQRTHAHLARGAAEHDRRPLCRREGVRAAVSPRSEALPRRRREIGRAQIGPFVLAEAE
ncbi:hypothetical protein HPB51_012309 [Rhipicephalus microplus]|uniref:Uncharacterized protein n=1 Tax=Rhipicephalus microplus TaxID=6941 RepID=A0A9J6D9D5_RHIMP|nr:hypothetical protein HPB51_012309 [Rhipicephalus microplus]